MENNLLDEDQLTKPNVKVRPGSITVICILLLLGVAANMVFLVKDFRSYGGMNTNVLIYAFSILIASICIIGLWAMKKWAVYLFTALIILYHLANLIYGGGFSIVVITIHGVILLVLYKHLKEMD